MNCITRAFTYPRRRQNVLKVQRHGTQSEARSRGIIAMRGVVHMWLRMSLVKRTVGWKQGQEHRVRISVACWLEEEQDPGILELGSRAFMAVFPESGNADF